MRSYRAIALVVLVLACSKETTAPTLEDVLGTWPVRTINGSATPAIISQSNGHTVRVRSDTLLFRADGSFLRTTVTEDSSPGSFGGVFVVIDTFAGGVGTFTLSGSSVTLTFNSDHTSASAAVSGTTLSFTRAGSTFVFEKR